MEVYLVDHLLQTISNFVQFEYIDPRKAIEDFLKKNVKTPEDLKKVLLLLSTMNLTSNDIKDAKGTNLPGKHD